MEDFIESSDWLFNLKLRGPEIESQSPEFGNYMMKEFAIEPTMQVGG